MRVSDCVFLALLVSGCGLQPSAAHPLPPVGVDLGAGTPSTASCGQLPPGGACTGSTWLFCDASTGGVGSIDCSALGETCLDDPLRGPSCVSGPPPVQPNAPPSRDGGSIGSAPADLGPPPAGADLGSPCGDVPLTGVCDGNVARLCNPYTGAVTDWDCGAASRLCGVDTCAGGAWCCETPTSNATCTMLGNRGECDGNTARWCASDGTTVVSVDCGAQGQTCVVDGCTPGAFCC